LVATSEKPKKMRRRWPCGSGVHPTVAVVAAAAVAVLAPGTEALKMPPGLLKTPAASVEPPTTT